MEVLRLQAHGEPAPSLFDLLAELVPPEFRNADGLRGAPGLAAAMLWAIADRTAGRKISVTHVQIMEFVGCSEARSRQILDTLIGCGFCRRIDARRGHGGGIELCVYGPAQLIDRFQLRRRADCNQRTLLPSPDVEVAVGEEPGVEMDAGQIAETGGKNYDLNRSFRSQIAVLPPKNYDLEAPDNEDALARDNALTLKLKEKEKALLLFLSALKALPSADRASLHKRVLDRANAISDRLQKASGGFVHGVKRRIVLAAAMWCEGIPIEVGLGYRATCLAVVDAGDIDTAVGFAVRAKSTREVTFQFIGALTHRVRSAAGEQAARLPRPDQVRSACATIGLEWSPHYDVSPAEEFVRQRAEATK